MVCERSGDCKLQELAYFYGIRENRFFRRAEVCENRQQPPCRARYEKCIMCGQWLRICDEIQGVGAIDFCYRGMKTGKISAHSRRTLNCEFSAVRSGVRQGAGCRERCGRIRGGKTSERWKQSVHTAGAGSTDPPYPEKRDRQDLFTADCHLTKAGSAQKQFPDTNL